MPINHVIAVKSAPDLCTLYNAINNYLAGDSFSLTVDEKCRVAEEAARAFVVVGPRIAIADQLARFGSEIIGPLVALVGSTPHGEAKILASLVLLQKQNEIGVPCLLKEIANNGEYAVAAAIGLTNAGVTAHLPLLIDLIRNHPMNFASDIPTSSDDELLTLLRLLKDMHAKLPLDVINRYAAVAVPRYLKDALDRVQ